MSRALISLFVFSVLSTKVSAQEVDIKHLGLNSQGWEVAETSNFLIFHNQEKEFVERVASVAEKTRLAMNRKWFDVDGDSWRPKCELFLHANGRDYTHETGAPNTSFGHTHILIDPNGYRVISQRIDLRCDIKSMVSAVLPHETTHVVLAGRFGHHYVPRWVDEGIAILSEPKEKIDQRRDDLSKLTKEQNMFGLKELMEMKDYPDPSRIKVFYAQSVCLVDFLSKRRSPTAFTDFVRDGLNKGYNTALRTHYETDFASLEKSWQQFLENK